MGAVNCTAGQVSFTAFTLSSEVEIEVIVPWMLIITEDDGADAATKFLQAIEVDQAEQFVVRWTDVALAIDFLRGYR